MHKMHKTLLCIIVLSASVQAQSDTLWTRTYGGVEDDYGFSVQQTSDEGYIVAGTTHSFGAGLSNIYLIKTDADGDTVWTRIFGGFRCEFGSSVQQTDDGGYIVTGSTMSFGAGDSDVYLIKTDANGDTLWTRTYGGSGRDAGNYVQQTQDGGYIIVAETWSYGAGEEDIYLIKTDANGDTLWIKTFGGFNCDEGLSVRQTSDLGYIIAGVTNSYTTAPWFYDVYLIKTDEDGDTLWTRTYGGSSGDMGFDVQQTSDGGFIIAGGTVSYGAGGFDVYLIKTGETGDTLWTRTFGDSDCEEGYSVQQTADGGYIIAGFTQSHGAIANDVYLIKTDDLGNEEWHQTFGGGNTDNGHSVYQTVDGGYIVAGHTNSFGAGLADFYLIRLEGEPELLTVTLTPYNPPVQIPSNGGSFEFNIAVANNGTNPAAFDVWTMATLPGGRIYGPILNVNLSLEPGTSIDRDRTQTIPAFAPTGDYTYDAYLGSYPNEIWDEDHFDFEKLAASDGESVITDWGNRGESLFGEYDWSDTIVGDCGIFHPPMPNPFNPETNLTFYLPDAGVVSLVIYDINGREIVRLIDGWRQAGLHKAAFDASALSSGIHFARLKAGSFHRTQKLLLIK